MIFLDVLASARRITDHRFRATGAPRRCARKGGHRQHCHYRWLYDLPLHNAENTLHVNWIEIEISNAKSKVTCCASLITDLDINKKNVAELADYAHAPEDRKHMLQHPQDAGIPPHA